MTASSNAPVFLADAESDPVIVRVKGRANFQNCGCLRDFVAEMRRQGKTRFILDFSGCTGMDSTFLGVLAGAAIELKVSTRDGSLVAARLDPGNLELLRNLGLHRLLVVDSGPSGTIEGAHPQPLSTPQQSEIETARLVLKAHEDLVDADGSNRSKFQDVLTLLRDRLGQKPAGS